MKFVITSQSKTFLSPFSFRVVVLLGFLPPSGVSTHPKKLPHKSRWASSGLSPIKSAMGVITVAQWNALSPNDLCFLYSRTSQTKRFFGYSRSRRSISWSSERVPLGVTNNFTLRSEERRVGKE